MFRYRILTILVATALVALAWGAAIRPIDHVMDWQVIVDGEFHEITISRPPYRNEIATRFASYTVVMVAAWVGARLLYSRYWRRGAAS
jgi:hypothetical protein